MAARPFFAVHPRNHRQIVGIGDLVRGYQPRTHDISGVKILALGRSQLSRHLLHLCVARTDVVEDTIAENMRARVLAPNVLPALPEKCAEFELVVQLLAVAWPEHVLAGSD